jgi:hypothetical protein
MAHLFENNGAHDVRFTTGELKQFNTELSKIEIKGECQPKLFLITLVLKHRKKNNFELLNEKICRL